MIEHSSVHLHVAHCGFAGFLLKQFSMLLLSSNFLWQSRRSFTRGPIQCQQPDPFSFLQEPGSCLTKHFWQTLDPFGVSTVVQAFLHFFLVVLYAISEHLVIWDLQGIVMQGWKKQALPPYQHRPAQNGLLLGQAGVQGLLLHRRTWIIFEKGTTTSSCQNSIPSCQYFHLALPLKQLDMM